MSKVLILSSCVVLFSLSLFAKGVKSPMKIFVEQNNSQVSISIVDGAKGKKVVSYKSETTNLKVKKKISLKNYRYYTKDLTVPVKSFYRNLCLHNFYTLNKKSECLDAKTKSAKAMRLFLKRIFYTL